MTTIQLIRAIACLIWLVCGICQGGLLGYASAFASALFLVALRLEIAGYED